MRPGAIRVESTGSFWWIDENASQYLRLPKSEAPRENPDWGKTGLLQDAVWHDFTGDWEISGDGCLRMWWGERLEECIVAPNALQLGGVFDGR